MGSHRYAGPRHARPAGPRHARPAPPSTLQRTAAAGGLAAALMVGESLGGVAGAVTPDTWAQLRMCEASGNYATNTGNGYYGAYQFGLATWQGLGYPGLPSAAAPAVQDAAAQALYQQRGWQPWPGCAAKLGLVDDRTADRGTQRPPLAPVTIPTPPAPVVAPPVVVTPVDASGSSSPGGTGGTTATTSSTPPAVAPVSAPTPAPTPAPVPPTPTTLTPTSLGSWDGHYLTTGDVNVARPDVTAWQQRMVAAGYPITVDGRYGPQSAAATTKFESAHGLAVESPGIVGPQVWAALSH